MKNAQNKGFKTIAAGSLVVIVLAILALAVTPRTRSVYPGNFMRGMMGFDSITTNSVDVVGRSSAMPEAGYAPGTNLGMMADTYSTAPIPPMMYGGKTAAEADARIIKSADLSIAVDGVEAKAQDVSSIATGRGGFVQSSTIAEDEQGNKSGQVVIRVPADTFDDAINAIKGLSVRVNRESVNGQDVTEQYTDLDARLRAAQAEEEQYLEILNKAETVQDILAVQQYLQNVRYEIESLQGQIDSLSNQTEYSTISVTLQEDVRVQVPAEKFDLIRNIKLALKYVVVLAQNAVIFLVWLIIVGGAVLLPLTLFIALVVWVVRKMLARL